MKDLKGTKTEKNLMEAFAGESQARNKYTFFASKAKKEGYVQISKIFEETARNEKEHAELWYKALLGGSIPTTKECLIIAAAGEHYEHTKMYAKMAKVAKEEGFDGLAKQFAEVAKIEAHHEQRYLKLAKNIEQGKVFKKDTVVTWKCDNCGHIEEGKQAPLVCPACKHPQAYQELFCENY